MCVRVCVLFTLRLLALQVAVKFLSKFKNKPQTETNRLSQVGGEGSFEFGSESQYESKSEPQFESDQFFEMLFGLCVCVCVAA